MANLTFITIQVPGQVGIGEGEDASEDIFDRFWPGTSPGVLDINLDNVDESMPALLQFMTKKVDFRLNFVTWNATIPSAQGVSSMNYYEARDEDFFVGNILWNPDSIESWSQQSFRIRPGVLNPGCANTLGIHTRNGDGEVRGDRDNFGIANIYLFYHLRAPN